MARRVARVIIDGKCSSLIFGVRGGFSDNQDIGIILFPSSDNYRLGIDGIKLDVFVFEFSAIPTGVTWECILPCTDPNEGTGFIVQKFPADSDVSFNFETLNFSVLETKG